MIRNPFKIKIKFEDQQIHKIHAKDEDDSISQMRKMFKKFK